MILTRCSCSFVSLSLQQGLHGNYLNTQPPTYSTVTFCTRVKTLHFNKLIFKHAFSVLDGRSNGFILSWSSLSKEYQHIFGQVLLLRFLLLTVKRYFLLRHMRSYKIDAFIQLIQSPCLHCCMEMWRMSTDPQEEGQPPRSPVHTPAVRLSMLDEWIWIHSFHAGSASHHLHHLPGAPASLPEKHCVMQRFRPPHRVARNFDSNPDHYVPSVLFHSNE